MKQCKNFNWGLVYRVACCIIFFIGVLLFFCGCVGVKVTKTLLDENLQPVSIVEIEYSRFLAPQEFEGFLINLETGELMFDKQKSETGELMYNVAKGLAEGLK